MPTEAGPGATLTRASGYDSGPLPFHGSALSRGSSPQP